MYTHLTQEDRVEIAAGLRRKWSYAEIAKRLRVHRSTVMREVNRNTVDGTYKVYTAHTQAKERRKYSKQKKLLGFKPSYNLEKGLRETIDWYINNPKKVTEWVPGER